MIELKGVTFAYRGHPPLFEGFNLRIEQGEAWAVIGPSGCGKTTLLYLMAGLRRPSAGTIMVAGSPILRPRPQTGLVLQDHGLLPWATVRDNAKLGLKIRRFYGPDGLHAPPDVLTDRARIEDRVDYWLRRLAIDSLQDKFPSQISRGQRQRTAIARTLALDPDVLLMDEPFSALDANIREDLQRVMMDFHEDSQLTSIVVTHDIEEAVFMGKKILLLKGTANRELHTIENEVAGLKDYRSRADFHRQCDALRGLLGDMACGEV
jgi:ABC-type nitrate/sulfonate/bicarbonate transport system ATPase subunit